MSYFMVIICKNFKKKKKKKKKKLEIEKEKWGNPLQERRNHSGERDSGKEKKENPER